MAAVEKVTVQQASGDLTKTGTTENLLDNNSFNTKINPFESGAKQLAQSQNANSQYSATNRKGLIFGNQIIEEPKVKEAASELPKINPAGTFGALSNYFKKIGSRVNEYDAAVDIVSKYLIKEGDLEDIVRSNPRIMAILTEAGLVQG